MFLINVQKSSSRTKPLTCSTADVTEDDVEIGRKGRHFKDIFSEADEGLVEQASFSHKHIARRTVSLSLLMVESFWNKQ